MNYEFKGIRFSAPKTTEGLLAERPKQASKCYISESALSSLIRRGALSMMAPAHHRSIFAANVSPNIREGMAADAARMTSQSQQLPNRGYFSAPKKKQGFSRGDRVIHSSMPGHKGTVLGESRSKPGLLKVAIQGQIYKVSPKYLKEA